MERRNVGSAACVENCSTMLFRSTNIIFGGLSATISPTTIKTGLTLLSTRTLLPSEPSKGALAPKPESYLYPGWAVFIIVTVVGGGVELPPTTILMTYTKKADELHERHSH